MGCKHCCKKYQRGNIAVVKFAGSLVSRQVI